MTRAEASWAPSIGMLCNTLAFFLAGWLSDRLGAKRVVLAGMTLIVSGLISMNFINSVWHYYLVWGLMMGGGGGLAFTISIDKLIAGWFDRKRGFALGLRFALIGIVAVIIIPIIALLVETQGWRRTCLIWAGIMILTLPLLFLYLKNNRPEYYGLLPDGANALSDSTTNRATAKTNEIGDAAGFQEMGFTYKQVMGSASFWMLTVAFFAQTSLRSFNIHLIPFITDLGIDLVDAGKMVSLMMLITIPSVFLGGYTVDRLRKVHLKFLLIGCFVLQVAGITVFLLNNIMAAAYLLIILYGLGGGAYTSLDAAIKARYFGAGSYGAIQGTSMLFSAPAGVIMPVYVGWIYDTTGTYLIALSTFVAIAVIAASLLYIERPPCIKSEHKYCFHVK